MTAERDEFLTGGMRPHACRRCGTKVLVKKNSEKHTSIQWTTDAASSCPVFAERVAGAPPRRCWTPANTSATASRTRFPTARWRSRMAEAHTLTVAEIVHETADACSVVFSVPPESAEAFRYSPASS